MNRDEKRERQAVRTPPGGEPAQAASSSSPKSPAHRRDVIIDAGCDELFQRHASRRSVGFRTVRVDVARHIANRDLTVLARASAVVFGARTAQGLPAADVIGQLRALEPQLGIYVIAADLSEVARVMPLLAIAGVDEVFCLRTRADERHLEETLRARVSAPVPETELRLLWKWFKDSPERPLVMHCIRNGFRLDDWSLRAAVFSACRRTLHNRMAAAGLPSPGVLARYGRVLHAQELTRRGVKPTSLVAELLGFPSASAMQRQQRRLLVSLMTRGRESATFASLLEAEG